jgi:anthranilate phosphoribosyltransferase
MYKNSSLAVAYPPLAAEEAAGASLARLFGGESLSGDEAEQLFSELVAGRLSEPAIAAMLIALRFKGETAEEMIGAARALRAADADFPRPDYLFADTCGTGGDGSSLINVSTAVAFVAAAAGLPIAKHGNRSVTSPCGSADVLEQLGAKLDVPAEVSRRALDETGVCFLLAPLYHPAFATRDRPPRAQGPNDHEPARPLPQSRPSPRCSCSASPTPVSWSRWRGHSLRSA